MTTNNPNSAYSTPKGSLEIPDYKTKSGKGSIRYICSKDWNMALKKLSVKFPSRYNSCKNWLQSVSVNTLKHLLKDSYIDDY